VDFIPGDHRVDSTTLTASILVLAGTLVFSTLWLLTRVEELVNWGRTIHIPKWLLDFDSEIRRVQLEERKAPYKKWRWICSSFYAAMVIAYLFSVHATPLLARLALTLLCILIFGVIVFFAERKIA
jgi:hypothetical protein